MKSAQVRQAGFGTTPLPEAAADDAVQNELTATTKRPAATAACKVRNVST
jgi:hypothetical protein